MGRSNNSNSGNNNSLISSGESGVVSGSSPAYLSNFSAGVPTSSTAPGGGIQHHPGHYAPNPHHHHHHHHHPPPHYSLPPSPPPIHPMQYISMGHLAAAQQFYEVANNGGLGGGGTTPPGLGGNNVTPPARVYSPMSHGSNSSVSSSVSSSASFASSTGGGNNTTLTIMGAMNAAAAAGSGVGSSVKFEYEDFPHEPDGGPVKTDTWKEHVAVFNMDQVGVMCDVLLQEGDMERLVDLLATVAKDFIGRSEKILRAQAHVAYHAAKEDPRKFPQVYKILETNSFSSQYHLGLQKLWFQAHYKEAEITRGRPLGAVDKYRIRRKFPLPRTIWDGEETVYCFKERSRNALRQSFALEKYPNLEEKKKLSQETGLTMTQVGNWFKNKRQREKEKMQGKVGVKRPKSYGTPGALAAMTPDLLGIMLSGQGGVNQAHHLHHHHPHHHHPNPHHQSHIAPLSPEDIENAIRKARYEEARLKNYIDESMYSHQQHASVNNPPPSMSPSNIQGYHNQHHHHNNGQVNTNNVLVSPRSTQMVLPGKSDITIGIVGNGNTSHPPESSPRLNQNGSGVGGGLTITAIPSPNNNNNAKNSSGGSPGEPTSVGGNMGGSPQQGNGNGDSMYAGQRPRSTPSNLGGGRCGTDLASYLHPNSAAHLNQHSPYHEHGHHHHHHPGHHTGLSIGGYEGGGLIHPGVAAALSHA